MLGLSVFTIDEDTIWGVLRNTNILVSISKKNFLMKYVAEIPEDVQPEVQLFSDLVCVGNEIYFAPFSANRIVVYDKISKNFSTISINKEIARGDLIYDQKYKFCNIFRYERRVILIPSTFPAIVVIDTKTKNVSYLSEPVRTVGRKVSERVWGRQYFYRAYRRNEFCYIGSLLTSHLIKLSLKDLSYELLEFACMQTGIRAGAELKESFLLIPSDLDTRAIYRMNEKGILTDVGELKGIAGACILCGEKLFIYSVFYRKDGNLYVYNSWEDSFDKLGNFPNAFTFCAVDGKYVWFVTYLGLSFFRLDADRLEIVEIEIGVGKELKNIKTTAFTESEQIMGLQEFIDIL